MALENRIGLENIGIEKAYKLLPLYKNKSPFMVRRMNMMQVNSNVLFRALTVMFIIVSASPCMEATNNYADVWDRFTIIIWQWRTPPPGDTAKRAYESINVHGIHLDDGFSDELLQFAIANNYCYYVDHAAGKGDLYLYRNEWQSFHRAYKRSRRRPVRPRCLRDPSVMTRMKAKLMRNITRAKVGRAIAYAFDDEISTTKFTTPVDLCWSERCITAFRKWLRSIYGTIEALNAEWGTNYANFDEAEPLHVDDLRYVHKLPFDEWNLSRWCDHRTFMDDTFCEVLRELVAYANSIDSSRPAGFVGGQAPAAYGGYDYAKICRVIQWIEAYDVGATNEILRSFLGQARPHVQTFFATLNTPADKWFLWYYFAHGNRGVICWPASGGKLWFSNDGILPQIRALAPTFAELQGDIGKLLINASFDADPIAIYYSHPSIQVSWFMDIAPHRGTWVNRSSGLNNSNATDIINRWAWIKLLEDAGFQYEFVSYLDVREGKQDLHQYRVLILPRTLAMSDAEARAIRTFVANGGLLITDYLPAIFDEHGKGRERGALDDVFGVERDLSKGVLDGKNIAEVNAEFYQRPLRERLMYNGALRHNAFVLYERSLNGRNATGVRIGESMAFLERNFGRGRTVYLNITPIPYLLVRRQAGGEAYRKLIRGLLGKVGLHPRIIVKIGGKEEPLIERLIWRHDDTYYLCLIANPMRDVNIGGVTVEEIISDAQSSITIEFTMPVRNLTNIRSTKHLGNGRRFQDVFNWCEANIYSFQPMAKSKR